MKKKTAGSTKPKLSQNLRRSAERLLQESAEKLKTVPEKDLKGLIHELRVHQVELEIQNEELRRAQIEIEESRNRYFDLYDLAPLGYFSLDRNGLVVQANLTGADLLGRQRGYLKGKLFSRFVLDGDQKIFFSHMRGLLETVTARTCELRLVTRDDTAIYVRMESVPVRNGTGDVIQVRSAVVDVTQEKQAELALRESEERFRLFAETSADIIFQIDLKGRVLYCSPSVEKILGYTPAEVKGTAFEKYVSYSDIPKVRRNFQRLIFREKMTPFEINVLAKSGTPVPLEVNASPLMRAGEIVWLLGILRDITERKRADEALKKERFYLSKAQEIGQIGTWDLDVKSNKLVWTDEVYRMFGIPVGTELTYESFLDLIHPQDRAYVDGSWGAALKKNPYDIEHRIIVEGKVKWVREKAELQFDENGNVIRAIGAAQDITNRKRMEEELRNSRDQLELRVRERTNQLQKANEALRAEVDKRKRYEEALKDSTQKILEEAGRRRFLSGKLVETLEKDRREVAMYLHDQIGQMMATFKMDLELFRKTVEGADRPPIEKLRGVDDKVVSILNHVRDISRKLRPDILDTLGLVPALRSLVEHFRDETGLRVHFYYRELSQKIDPDKSLALYRITQEALNNAAKHAQAKLVFVNLILKNHSIQLSVEDDGIGFDYPGKISNLAGLDTLGIMIMRERAVLAGGEFNIESQRGKGTHVVVDIPID